MDIIFKDNKVKLPNNKAQALRLLKGLRSRLISDEKFYRDYNKFMDKMLKNNYAERVPDNELLRDDDHIWYNLQHGVYHPIEARKGSGGFLLFSVFQWSVFK